MYKHSGNQQDWTNHYASIGEYVVEFENIVENIRFQLSGIFQIRGLKDWNLSEIVFGQKQFTAEPLITCFESISYELLRNKPESKVLLESKTNFKNRFKEQVAFRNDLLHSFYLIGSKFVTISHDPIAPED